jgi:hypothetical protein
MAEKGSSHRGTNFTARVVRDPKDPPRTLLLAGYTAASSEDGHVRIYFDP